MPQPSPVLAKHLLPQPRALRRHAGVCRVSSDSPIELGVDDARVERPLLRWRASLRTPRVAAAAGCREPGDERHAAAASDPVIRVVVDRSAPGCPRHRDGYRLAVRPNGIELVGGSPAGCFYGVQTLAQLSSSRAGAMPCCTILDWPDFGTRGLLHDITRGRVPTLETLKLLVDRLARLKVNQLQLYIEHAFVFAFDPQICASDEGLTPDEVRELDAYCRERFIDLVPALATLGHMGRILSMPQYRHLAEIEATRSWREMDWPQRARGLTLDCFNPQAHRLIERMWSDVLDAFSSPVVHICGDEPWDLGRGKNRERMGCEGRGPSYVEQIRRTHEICASRGRRTQAWSDVLVRHRELLHRLPRDLTLLHWGYDDETDYGATRTLVDAGLETFVCPSTCGFKRIINAIDRAERNITAFAAAGRTHGATGLINTDWGDHGHFHLPACSGHGIAMGAALAWRADHPTGRRFDECFARVMWGVEDVSGVALLRGAARWADGCETWRLLWTPLAAAARDASLPAQNEVTEARRCAAELRSWCASLKQSNAVDPLDAKELAVAARCTELLADKTALAHCVRGGLKDAPLDAVDPCAWAGRLMETADAYADCWRARNKPSGLDDILNALSAAANDVRTLHP